MPYDQPNGERYYHNLPKTTPNGQGREGPHSLTPLLKYVFCASIHAVSLGKSCLQGTMCSPPYKATSELVRTLSGRMGILVYHFAAMVHTQ